MDRINKLKYYIKKVIKEEWFNSLKKGNKTLEIFKNPTKRELKEVIYSEGKIKKWTKVRGYLNTNNLDIFIWKPLDTLHDWIFIDIPIEPGNDLEFSFIVKSGIVFIHKRYNKGIDFDKIDLNPIKERLLYVFNAKTVYIKD